jgi:Na+:H+ antiporter
LPQVAATLAATLVAYGMLGAKGQRLLDNRMLSIVLVLVTAILGPVLTEHFAARMAERKPMMVGPMIPPDPASRQAQ